MPDPCIAELHAVCKSFGQHQALRGLDRQVTPFITTAIKLRESPMRTPVM